MARVLTAPPCGGLLVAALAGCHQIFGTDPPIVDAAIDADPTAPRITVPALFVTDAPDRDGPYLFEGTAAGSTSLPVPVVVDVVGASDIVTVRVPGELGEGWRICDQPVSGELELELGTMCRRGPTSLAFTVVVPVSAAVGAGDSVSPLVVSVRRGDRTFELPIAIVPLDELVATVAIAEPVDGLFSTIEVAAVSPSRPGPALTWRAVSDVLIGGVIDVRGVAGTSDTVMNPCSDTVCPGGLAGPGSTSAGGTSTDQCHSTPTGCSASTPSGGLGTPLCSTGGTCASVHVAGSGGGGGHALGGVEGAASSGNMFCGGDASGGDGGAAGGDTFSIAWVGGGGGAAGGALVASGTTNGWIYGGGGGGGGGVVVIDTLGRLGFTAGGRILASGGAGGAGGSRTCNNFNVAQKAGDGGGGAGGTIRLRAHSIGAGDDLDQVLIAAGGGTRAQPAGVGAAGRIRVDALDADSLNLAAGVVRGPDFDVPASIVDVDTVAVTARSWSAGDSLYWGVRAAAADRYDLTTSTAGAGAVTLDVPLAPGLNELCVFVGPQTSASIAEIPEAAKRCAWVARVVP